jgi:hypothetical protein
MRHGGASKNGLRKFSERHKVTQNERATER